GCVPLLNPWVKPRLRITSPCASSPMTVTVPPTIASPCQSPVPLTALPLVVRMRCSAKPGGSSTATQRPSSVRGAVSPLQEPRAHNATMKKYRTCLMTAEPARHKGGHPSESGNMPAAAPCAPNEHDAWRVRDEMTVVYRDAVRGCCGNASSSSGERDRQVAGYFHTRRSSFAETTSKHIA